MLISGQACMQEYTSNEYYNVRSIDHGKCVGKCQQVIYDSDLYVIVTLYYTLRHGTIPILYSSIKARNTMTMRYRYTVSL